MRVALTGGGGFIGSHVLARMVGAGMDVTLLGPETGHCRYAASLVASGQVRHLRCDSTFRDADRLRDALGPVDAVVLLGYVMPGASGAARLAEEIELNVVPLSRLLRALDGCSHFVFASTLEVYDGGEVDGDEPGPVTAFGFAKLTAERMLRVFAPASTATILRYASVYGPYEPERRAIPRLIRDALAGTPLLLDSDGSEERDYLHVCDAAAATIAAVERKADGAYDIGTGMATRTLDLARTIGELAGAKARPVSRAPVEGESRPPRLVAATRRAQEELGFAARRHLVDGLKEEIGWIRSQPTPKVGVALAATA